jgi:pimeloyl-ACP methyl ester carboxylesterase/DNA-binding CsgD family transcriptional regulator
MDAPPIQYVTTRDGLRIAFCVAGKGRPLVFLPNNWNHIQMFWRTPWRRSLFEPLAQRFRLVQYDARGQGLSSRGLQDSHAFDAYIKDLEAVVDHLALDRFVILARNLFTQVAVRYTALHPERVEALVLGNPVAELYHGFEDLARQRWDVYTETIARLTNLPQEASEIAREFRLAMDQADHLKLTATLQHADVAGDVERLTMPALVISSATSPIHSHEWGIQLASRLPRAQFLTIDDRNGSFFSSGSEIPPAVAVIERFLGEVQSGMPVPTSLPSGLSQREAEVLRLLAAGRSNAQIADELVISQNTVIRHVSNIYAKTGAANRAEASAYAAKQGLI